MNKKITVLYVGPEEGLVAVNDEVPDSMKVINCNADIKSVTNNIKSVNAFIDASMKVPISNEMIMNSKNLKIISTATTGSDHIDNNALNKRSITLNTLKEDSEFLFNITSAAEHSWALLICLARKLPHPFESVKKGEWSRENFPGIMLNGKTLGLVGCGRIGQWMSKYGKAFGMNVAGYDPYISNWPEGIKKVSLEDIFCFSDFISIHVHLNELTRHLINGKLLSSLKKGAFLINTSRGGVIDEKALLKALNNGNLKGAGLDVLDGEPNIENHPLVEYAKINDNLLITPHCAGYSPDAVKLVCKRAAQKVVNYFNN